MIPNGSVGCDDGCEFMSQSNGDGTFSRFFIGDSASSHCSVVPNQCTNNGAGYTMNYGLSMCVPPPGPDCAPNEVKDPNTGACSQACPAGSALDAHGLCKPDVTQCPAGQIRSPEGNCLPGDGQCAAGEARKPDGTCGRDSDGDGTADDFDPETDSASFSGGDNCDSPPTCNGDVIMCGIARINWRIECNTRKDAKVSGGSCDAVPVCAGRNCDALEYAQLLSQWRTSCAVSALASDGAGTGGSDGVVDYLQGAYATEKGLLEAIGSGADGTEGVNEGDLWANFGEGDFNPNMFGTASGGSCNFNTTLELLGRPIDLPPAFWTLMQAIGWLVAASGYLWVAIRLAS